MNNSNDWRENSKDWRELYNTENVAAQNPSEKTGRKSQAKGYLNNLIDKAASRNEEVVRDHSKHKTETYPLGNPDSKGWTWVDGTLFPIEELEKGTDPETYDPFGSLGRHIIYRCDQLKDLLIAKNKKYGSSVSEGLKVFSDADYEERIAVRIDDKLSRISNGHGFDDDEDTVIDLVGYLILYLAIKDSKEK